MNTVIVVITKWKYFSSDVKLIKLASLIHLIIETIINVFGYSLTDSPYTFVCMYIHNTLDYKQIQIYVTRISRIVNKYIRQYFQR